MALSRTEATGWSSGLEEEETAAHGTAWREGERERERERERVERREREGEK